MKEFNELKDGNLKCFYSLNVLQRIEVLKNLGFYNLPVEKRIKYLETIGVFDVDVNLDPKTKVLMPDDKDLDYLKVKKENKDKYDAANKWSDDCIKDAISSGRLKIDGIEGAENLEILKDEKQGAIITVNHFNPLDTFAIESTIHSLGIDKELFKVTREGNYTNFPEGPVADYFKFGRTLPLSQNMDTMKMFLDSTKTILKDGKIVLVCSEQAMWENYQKPKPMKYGAYRWATQANVPVIPMFIGHKEDKESASYTIYMGKPIYSKEDKTLAQNTVDMRNENFEFCKSAYEKYYDKKLTYDTDPKMYLNFRGYVRSTPEFEQMIQKENIDMKEKKER